MNNRNYKIKGIIGIILFISCIIFVKITNLYNLFDFEGRLIGALFLSIIFVISLFLMNHFFDILFKDEKKS